MPNISTKVLWRIGFVTYALVFLILNWSLGIIVNPHGEMLPLQRRDIGAALALPVIGAFCLFMLPIIVSRAKVATLQSAVATQSSLLFARVYAKKIQRLPAKLLPTSAVLGTIVVMSYFYAEGLFYLPELSFLENSKRFPLLFQTLVMWTSVVWGILLIYNVTRILTRYLTKHLNVNVFSAEGLFPIANTIFWNALFFCFGVALAPLFWLGEAPPLIDFIMTMTVLIILINLMFYPLMRAHQIIVKKKGQALALHHKATRYMSMSAEDLQHYLSIYQPSINKDTAVSVTEEIIAAREWPVNIHLAIRFCCLLALPVMTWLWATILNFIVLMLPRIT